MSPATGRRRRPGAAALAFPALLVLLPAALPAQPDQRLSGAALMSPELQAMQADPVGNPGLLWALQGAAAWDAPAGAGDRSCASCHGPAETAMRGVAARYPAFDEAAGRPFDLAARVDACRTRHQRAAPFAAEDDTLLALLVHLGRQSQGLPISPPADPRLDEARAQGRALFELRQGQLGLSCSQCHDDHWGRRLAGNTIPQAHPTGYPIYRLEWQGWGSLQRRLRNCLAGVRALPFAYGAPELVALELFLMERARGMPIETPAVRP